MAKPTLNLGRRLRQVSGEANSYAYLTQRLLVAIQRGNAASMLGTIQKICMSFVLSFTLMGVSVCYYYIFLF